MIEEICCPILFFSLVASACQPQSGTGRDGDTASPGDQDRLAADDDPPGDSLPSGDATPPACGSGYGPLPNGLVELAWDTGTPSTHIGAQSFVITVDETAYALAEEVVWEAVRFELEHPAKVYGFAIQWGGLPVDGDPRLELEAGLYPDFGYNGFDFWRWDPYGSASRCLADVVDGEWLTYLLPEPVEFEQPGLVYVAHRRAGTGEPAFFFSAGASDCDTGEGCHSACNLPEVATYQYNGLSFPFQYDYLVRLYVEYTAELLPEDRFFQALPSFSLSSRVAFGDYDNDGWDDILTDGPRLWRNNGDGTFTDTSAQALPGVAGDGGVWGDYDNDGCLDLFIFAQSLTVPDSLLHSRCDGTFEDVSAAVGIIDEQSYNNCNDAANICSPSPAAAWIDIDADGLLDLYIANYICAYDGSFYRDTVFHNEGGAFTEWTGLNGFLSWEMAGRGANPVDHDDDGDVDLLVNNYRLQRNLFYENSGDATVSERARTVGLSGEPWGTMPNFYYGHTIGTAWGDIDNDNDFDSIQANLAHPRFFHFSDKTQVLLNDAGTYTDISGDWTMPESAAGLRYQETHSSPVLADFDQDGNLDLVITAVYPGRPTDFYWGLGDGTFELDVYAAGITTVNGWGAAAADIDNDGDLDLAAYSLFENQLPGTGHWVQVRVIGNVAANWAAIGATVMVDAGGLVRRRYVQGGSGQGCQDSLTLHFGLGSADRIDAITVRFPDNSSVFFNGPLAVDQRLWLYEDGTLHAGWTPL